MHRSSASSISRRAGWRSDGRPAGTSSLAPPPPFFFFASRRLTSMPLLPGHRVLRVHLRNDGDEPVVLRRLAPCACSTARRHRPRAPSSEPAGPAPGARRDRRARPRLPHPRPDARAARAAGARGRRPWTSPGGATSARPSSDRPAPSPRPTPCRRSVALPALGRGRLREDAVGEVQDLVDGLRRERVGDLAERPELGVDLLRLGRGSPRRSGPRPRRARSSGTSRRSSSARSSACARAACGSS